MSITDNELRDQATSHIESLLSEFYDNDGVRVWMTSPHRQLGGSRAVDLISEGRATEVLAVVGRLRDGAFS